MGFNNEKEMSLDLYDKYLKKVKILNETIWDNKATRTKILDWLSNFEENERLNSLFLLTEFIYFNKHLVKQMLVSIYRDLYKYREIEKIRKNNSDTLDEEFIKSEFKIALSKTRFLIIGNASESSGHLLYPFRQENKISKSLCQTDEDYEDIEHFVFIDDFCGSGQQAVDYSIDILPEIKNDFPNAKISYFMMVSTKEGKQNIIENSSFDIVDCVLELDNSYKCFSKDSRIFKNKDDIINIEDIKQFSGKYGKELIESILLREEPEIPIEEKEELMEINKHGFNDGQLLIGFEHNTPDNTMPIFWYDEEMIAWTPIFKRYNKIY